MAISSVSPLPKSQPDISKLNTFTGFIVNVTKHLGPRGTTGTSIVASKKMSKDDLLQLQDRIPGLPGCGPGYYSFTVSDEGGTGDDMWLVKLGPDLPQQQQENFMGGSNGVSPPGALTGGVTQALGEGVIHLGHNFFYNEAMGTLTTPWRTIVSWKQGDPMPQPPTSAAATPFVPPPSQWGAGQPQPGQWGGYPVVSEDSAAVKRLEQELAAERQRRREDDQRAATERAQAEMRQLIADSNTRFEKLIATLMTKSQGDDPAVAAIKAQNEQLQRQIEQDRRDAQAREAASQTREEMRRMKEDTDRMIQSITANKSDPMLTMMMQMMSQSNASAMEAVKAIQASTSTANTSAERQVASLVEQMRGTIISPIQMMEMMRSSRGDGAEMSKMVLETTKEMNTLQRNVFEQLLDASSSGGQPPWLQAVQAAMDKIGPIGAALAERAAQPKVVERIVRVGVPVDAQGRPVQAQPQQGAMAGAPAGKAIDAQATVVEPPAKKRGRPSKKDKAARPMTTADLREVDPDELAESLKDVPDEKLFGETLFGFVKLIRENVEKGMLPEQVSGGLWDKRNELTSLVPLPMAVELFMADQIDVLIERLLPGADEAYLQKVVTGLEEKIAAEAGGMEE